MSGGGGLGLATGTPAEEIARLRSEPGKAIAVSGGARFARSLLADGLLDELRLAVHPVVLGGGTPLFTDLHRFELLSTRAFAGGAVQHVYAPARG